MNKPRPAKFAGHSRPGHQLDCSILQVHSGTRIASGSSHLKQLLDFQFGANARTAPKPGQVSVALQPLTPESTAECWRVSGPVHHQQDGPLRLVESSYYTAAIVELPETGHAGMKELSQQAYKILLTAVSSGRHRRLLRIWNYFDEINESEGNEERYRLFSSGRAMAFSQFGIEDQATPVGTAIGTAGSGKLLLVALASEQAFRAIENPRQISAYHYPTCYGPDSPKFSRAGLLAQPAGRLFLVSGTAAVVGHDSAHPFDTSRQISETLTNLETLAQAGSNQRTATSTFKPVPAAVFRVYLRNANDLPVVEQALRDAWGELPRNIIFLQGAICRRELMVEMEAVLPVE